MSLHDAIRDHLRERRGYIDIDSYDNDEWDEIANDVVDAVAGYAQRHPTEIRDLLLSHNRRCDRIAWRAPPWWTPGTPEPRRPEPHRLTFEQIKAEMDAARIASSHELTRLFREHQGDDDAAR